MEYQKKLDEQKKLREEVLKKKEAARQAARSKEALTRDERRQRRRGDDAGRRDDVSREDDTGSPLPKGSPPPPARGELLRKKETEFRTALANEPLPPRDADRRRSVAQHHPEPLPPRGRLAKEDVESGQSGQNSARGRLAKEDTESRGRSAKEDSEPLPPRTGSVKPRREVAIIPTGKADDRPIRTGGDHHQSKPAKQVSLVNRRQIQVPPETPPDYDDNVDAGVVEDLQRPVEKSMELKPEVPLALRSSASSLSMPTLPDLPLPNYDLEAETKLKQKQQKRQQEAKKCKLRIVQLDKATGIITTADGVKMKAVMMKTTKDGKVCVTKKYIKCSKEEMAMMTNETTRPPTRKPSQGNLSGSKGVILSQPDNSVQIRPAHSTTAVQQANGKLQRTVPTSSMPCSTEPVSSSSSAKQPLSQRFNQLNKPGPNQHADLNQGAECTNVLLSDLGHAVTAEKLRTLCSSGGTVKSIQFRKSQGVALVRFKYPDHAKAFVAKHNSSFFENQRIAAVLAVAQTVLRTT